MAVPTTGSVSLSNLRGIFGGRAGITGIYFSDYQYDGQFTSNNVDWQLTDSNITMRGLDMLRGRQQMMISDIQVNKVTDSNIQISWSGQGNSFTRVTWPGNASNIPTGIITFTIPGLTANQLHDITVQPVSRLDRLGTKGQQSQILLLPRISSISVTNLTETSAVVSWPTGQFTTVRVSWTTGSTTNTSSLLPTSTTTFTVTGLLVNTVYLFSITPFNVNNVGGTERTSSLSTLPSVASISVTNLTETSAVVSWPTGQFTTVRVSWTTGSTTNTSSLLPTSTATFTVTGLLVNTVYLFSITPFNVNNVGGTERTSSLSTLPSVASISVANVTKNSAVVSWPASQYTSIRVSWVTGGVTNMSAMLTSATNFTVTSLQSSTSYTFSITPYNNNGVAGLVRTSAIISTLSAIAAVTSISITDIAPTSVRVNWSGGTYDRIKVSWTNVSNNTTVSSNFLTNVTFFNVTNLLSYVTYTFTVTSYDLTDTVGPSSSSQTRTLSTVIVTSTSGFTITGSVSVNFNLLTRFSDTANATLLFYIESNITSASISGNILTIPGYSRDYYVYELKIVAINPQSQSTSQIFQVKEFYDLLYIQGAFINGPNRLFIDRTASEVYISTNGGPISVWGTVSYTTQFEGTLGRFDTVIRAPNGTVRYYLRSIKYEGVSYTVPNTNSITYLVQSSTYVRVYTSSSMIDPALQLFALENGDQNPGSWPLRSTQGNLLYARVFNGELVIYNANSTLSSPNIAHRTTGSSTGTSTGWIVSDVIQRYLLW